MYIPELHPSTEAMTEHIPFLIVTFQPPLGYGMAFVIKLFKLNPSKDFRAL